MVGLAIGTVTRSAVVAITVGTGYLMVFEGLLALLAEDLTTYLPGSVLSALAAGGTPDLAWGTAAGLAVGYAAVAMVIGGRFVHASRLTS